MFRVLNTMIKWIFRRRKSKSWNGPIGHVVKFTDDGNGIVISGKFDEEWLKTPAGKAMIRNSVGTFLSLGFQKERDGQGPEQENRPYSS